MFLYNTNSDNSTAKNYTFCFKTISVDILIVKNRIQSVAAKKGRCPCLATSLSTTTIEYYFLAMFSKYPHINKLHKIRIVQNNFTRHDMIHMTHTHTNK